MAEGPPTSSGSWGWRSPDYQEPEPAGPRIRHLGLIAALGVLIAGLLLVFTIVGGDSGGSFNPIAQAAERTAGYPGARVSLNAVYTSPALPQAVQLQGHGVFNGETQKGRITASAELPGHGSFRVDEITDGGTTYLASSMFASELPEGKTWIKVSELSGDDDVAALGQSDAKAQLEVLKASSSDFLVLGDEKVRGVTTTHYRATVDNRKYEDLLRFQGNDEAADQLEAAEEIIGTTMPVDVWIDDRKLVRRLRLSVLLQFDPEQETALTMTMEMDFFDFGITPEIALPPASSVFDVTEYAKKRLEELGP
jgi:hypothetical protein